MQLATLQRFFSRNSYLLALVVMLITIYINADLQENLFEDRALRSNFRLFLPLALVAAGQTIVIIGGGIDLSVGWILTMVTGVITTNISADNPSDAEVTQAIMYGIGAGILAGVFNGICVAFLRLQPIVATYATSFIYRGIALYLLPEPVRTVPREWSRFYRDEVYYDMPLTFWLLMLLLVLWLILRTTRYAQFIYASGSKAEAAYPSGVPVSAVKFSTYVIGGLMSALAGVALAVETGVGSTFIATEATLESIVVVVLGGTRLSGGQGGVVGSIIGVVTLKLFSNIIPLIDDERLPPDYDTLVIALVIIAALAGPGLVRQVRSYVQEVRLR